MKTEQKIDRAALIEKIMRKLFKMSDIEMLVAQGYIDGFAARGDMEAVKEATA